MAATLKTLKREVRRRRIRSKVSGTLERPRLAIFKSNRYIFAQLIDDSTGKTIVSANGKTLKAKTKTEQATAVGKEIASLALAKSIKKVVFDRGGYIYTGRIKAVADAAREGGLEF
ncbi:MAG TPA: 50S ribosomal protein L18 [Candidatus Paceibacterota bacterium]|nr:50S ribosomal protein L18 [Candidatus Paceibacterota bacterium]